MKGQNFFARGLLRRWKHTEGPIDRLKRMETILDSALASTPMLHMQRAASSKTEDLTNKTNPGKKFPTSKIPVETVAKIKSHYEANRHSDVLIFWESLKNSSPISITGEILSIVAKSAMIEDRPRLAMSAIELGQSLGQEISLPLGLDYIKACRESGTEKYPTWSKAVGMLEDLLMKINPKSNVQMRRNPELLSCFEETVHTCARQGRWRNVLDVLERMHKDGFAYNEAILSLAISCCAKESGGVPAAYNLYRHMIRSKIPRSTKLYTSLLQGLQKTKQTDAFETVWTQLMSDRLPRTDAMYASRVEAHFKAGNIILAEKSLDEALLSIKRPKLTYDALYQGLLKAGLGDKALKLVDRMKTSGFQPPSEQDVNYHLQSLAKAGLYQEALSFLKASKLDTCKVSEPTWNALFKGAVAASNADVATEVYAMASAKAAGATTVQSTSDSSEGIDTTTWIPQLLRVLGDAGHWADAVDFVNSMQAPSPIVVASLVRLLGQCGQPEEAVKYHLKYLKSTGFSLGVSQAAVQSLSAINAWPQVRQALDDIYTHSTSSTNDASDAARLALPHLYTTAVKGTVKAKRSHGQASALMKDQAAKGLQPTWNCARFAMKAMYDECAWAQLLDIFAVRTYTSQYLPGDEVTYGRAISACGNLGRWDSALELLADLLIEKDRPGSVVFEITLDILVQCKQNSMIPQILQLQRDRGVPLSTKVVSLCAPHLPPRVRDQLLRDAIKSGISLDKIFGPIQGIPFSSESLKGNKERDTTTDDNKDTDGAHSKKKSTSGTMKKSPAAGKNYPYKNDGTNAAGQTTRKAHQQNAANEVKDT